MTLSTVRVGVVGLGAFGETRVAALGGLVGVEIAAVCSRRADRAAEISTRYRVPRQYTDWQALVRDAEADAPLVQLQVDALLPGHLMFCLSGGHTHIQNAHAVFSGLGVPSNIL